MERFDYFSEEVEKTETASCSKCGKIVNLMHLAPAFITVCRECYIRENPNLEDF
jgi:NMD protein affecting ribosome stability and mRNA decay